MISPKRVAEKCGKLEQEKRSLSERPKIIGAFPDNVGPPIHGDAAQARRTEHFGDGPIALRDAGQGVRGGVPHLQLL